MAHYICHASIDEHGKAKGGAAGDQTGREVCKRTYYRGGEWNGCLRYPNAEIRKKAAEIVKKLCSCNLVGYDQNQRNTLYQKLKKYNFDVDAYIKSKEKAETDCSELMYAVYACLLPSIRSDANAPSTHTMLSKYKEWGFKLLDEKKYLKNADYLTVGDILVITGHHTVMSVSNGSKASVTTTTTTAAKKAYTGAFPKLPARGWFQNGDVSNEVKVLKGFLNWFGAYGLDVNNPNYLDRTEACVKDYQKKVGITSDGEFGKDSLAAAKKVLK